MIKHEGDIYCDVHGCVHEPLTNPYEGCPTEHDKDGNPIWLRYAWLDEDGNETNCGYGEKPKVKEVTVPMEPECLPENWKILWIGKRYA
jgi:hypothetical protein